MNKLLKKMTIILLILVSIPMLVSADEIYYIGDSTRHVFLRNKSVGVPYITIDGQQQAYCADFYKKTPSQNKYVKVEYEDDGIISLLYNGYLHDFVDLKEKYSLTDEETLVLTQLAIWKYIENWEKSNEDHPYVDEMLSLAENKEIDKKEFAIDENALIFEKAGEYKETKVINTKGGSGKFVIKAENDNLIALDMNGNIRYEYEVGESFKIRKLVQNKESDKIIITGNNEVLSMDLYASEDRSVQDLIVPVKKSDNFTFNYTIKEGENVVQTGDEEFIYLMVILAGIVVYILLNMDFKKRY